MYNFIFIDEHVLFYESKKLIYDLIKWLVIYIKRDWRQLFKKKLYID
jgi:hypothetical protein